MDTVLSGKERRPWLFVELLKERLWGVTEQGWEVGVSGGLREHCARCHLPLAYYTFPGKSWKLSLTS